MSRFLSFNDADLIQRHQPEIIDELSQLPIDNDETRDELASNPKLMEFLILTLTTPKITQKLLEKVLYLIAEIGKSEEARVKLTDESLISAVSNTLKSLVAGNFVEPTVLQGLRALANICYENENARELIHETRVISSIASLLHRADSGMNLQKVACSCLLNIALDFEAAQNELVSLGCLPHLIRMLKEGSGMNAEESVFDRALSAANLLNCLFDCDETLSSLINEDLLKNFVETIVEGIRNIEHNIMSPDYYDFVHTCVDSLEDISNKEAIKNYILSRNMINSFLELASKRKRDSSSDAEKNELNRSIYLNVCKIILGLSANEANIQGLATESVVLPLIKLFEDPDDEIRSLAVLSLGNIARSDMTCSTLIRDLKTLPPLMKIYDRELIRMKSKENLITNLKDIVRVLHAVTGTLRNMSICEQEREYIGSQKLIIDNLFITMTHEEISLLRSNCIAILKNLVTKNIANAYNIYKFIGIKEAIDAIMEVVWKSQDENGPRSECGRLLGHLIRNTAQDQNLLLHFSRLDVLSVLLQNFSGASIILFEERSYHEDAESGSTFPILQYEAIIPMLTLINGFEEVGVNLCKYKAFGQTCSRLIEGDDSQEMKESVCAMIELLSSKHPASRVYLKRYLRDGLIRMVEKDTPLTQTFHRLLRNLEAV